MHDLRREWNDAEGVSVLVGTEVFEVIHCLRKKTNLVEDVHVCHLGGGKPSN